MMIMMILEITMITYDGVKHGARVMVTLQGQKVMMIMLVMVIVMVIMMVMVMEMMMEMMMEMVMMMTMMMIRTMMVHVWYRSSSRGRR
jgi:hypothetical protein